MNFSTTLGLSRVSDVKYSQLLAIVANIDRNYRQFSIAKGGGGRRIITTPRPTLKSIQSFLNEKVIAPNVKSPSAHAYVSGRSIVSHARAHVESNDFVKIDIRNFFPSITKDDVGSIFQSLGYEEQMAAVLATLCSYQGSLPQGAPSSPALSNLRMAAVDLKLLELSDKLGVTYTRYADDIVISGKRFDRNLLRIAVEIVEDDGFSVNLEKTYYARNPKKMVLTGISISEKRLTVPKSFKRAVRKSAYDLLSAEGISALFSEGKFLPFKFDEVLGRLAFWSYVEPHAEFPRRYRSMLMNRYKDLASPRLA